MTYMMEDQTGPNAKFLMKHTPSNRFLRPDGKWTEHAERALIFNDAGSVWRFCFENQIQDVEPVMV